MAGGDDEEAEGGAPTAGAGEVLSVSVTEVASGNEFFVQVRPVIAFVIVLGEAVVCEACNLKAA